VVKHAVVSSEDPIGAMVDRAYSLHKPHAELEHQPDVLKAGMQIVHLLLEVEQRLQPEVEVGFRRSSTRGVWRVHGHIVAAVGREVNPATQGTPCAARAQRERKVTQSPKGRLSS